MLDKYGYVVVFHKGKRTEFRVPRDKFRKAIKRVKKLKAKGVKAHFVYRTEDSVFPPPRQIERYRGDGYLWCPYCRAWRFFSIPPWRETKPGQLDILRLFLNSANSSGTKVCQWCTISENEWYVRKANGTWGEVGTTRRRKRTRSRRR